MDKKRIAVVLLLTASLLHQAGCRTTAKRAPEFSALTTPVSYRAPAPETAEPPKGFLGKAKSGATKVVKGIGVGAALVGYLFLRWRDDDDDGFDPDPLWHQGYGFNNPNPERMQKGQPLLNFDGSVAD